MKNFKVGDDVEILGTDSARGYITLADPTNSDLYSVALYERYVGAVYPYYGKYRLYPEYMLTKCLP